MRGYLSPERAGRSRVPAAADHRPVRRRQPADVQRGRHHLGGLQRRNLQLPRPAHRARSARPPLQVACRHRSARAPVRGARRGICRGARRHVRDRHLGRPRTAAWCSPATAPARSRCSSTATAGGSCSDRRSRRSSPILTSGPTSTRRGFRSSSRTATCSTRTRFYQGVRQVDAGHGRRRRARRPAGRANVLAPRVPERVLDAAR